VFGKFFNDLFRGGFRLSRCFTTRTCFLILGVDSIIIKIYAELCTFVLHRFEIEDLSATRSASGLDPKHDFKDTS